jgi:hypothetical protein
MLPVRQFGVSCPPWQLIPEQVRAVVLKAGEADFAA